MRIPTFKMLKAKMTLSSLSIPIDQIKSLEEVGKVGTSFELRAKLKVSKRKAGSLSGEGIDSLELEWKETCDWFEFTNNRWTFKGTDPNTDLYASHPDFKTFTNWRKVRYLFAAYDELGNAAPPGLKEASNKGKDTVEQDKAAKHWIAENGFEWTLPVAVDRPALLLEPAGESKGGARPSLVTTKSRRRVLYFDLGFKGSLPRVTATQILETVNGKPTLQKLLVPAVTRAQANDETNLAKWRQEFH